jgi:predicted permease
MPLLSDLRFAARTWLRRPILTAAAVITLALGTGANTAIFSVIHAVMLKPLPYPQPRRLVQIWSVDPSPTPGSLSIANKRSTSSRFARRFHELSPSIANIAWYRPWMMNVSTGGDPDRVLAAMVSPSFFATLGVTPDRGRGFTESEMIYGQDHVVILSDAFWRSRFHADSAMLGRTAILDGNAFTVVGVMPAGHRMFAPNLPEQPEVYAPISILEQGKTNEVSAWFIARLKPDVTLAAARAEIDRLFRRLQREEPNARKIYGANIVPLAEEVASNVRGALLILLGAAGCVLLIACANLANLTLAHTAARQKELGVRTALGAGRGRLIRQLLTESAALSLIGGAAGAVLSRWIVQGIAGLYPGNIPRFSELRPEPLVFGFTLAVALITAVLFGALPAWRFSRPDLQDVLKGSDPLGAARGGFTRNALLAAQVAIAMVLLVGAGLLLRSFLLLQGIDPGYQRHNLLTAHLSLPDKLYSSDAQKIAFADQLLERFRSIPAVESAAITNSLPLAFNFLISVEIGIEGRPDLGAKVRMDSRSVTPGYFTTMAIRLTAGRYLAPSDAIHGAVVVNQAFVREFFPDQNPVGRNITFHGDPLPIVGVVADVKNMKLDANTKSEIYVPFSRLPTNFMDLAIVTRSDPAPVTAALRAELRAVDPNQPLGKVETMEQILDSSVARPRFSAVLLGSFAALALVLAGVGIYGVIAYSVSLRTREIGIRIAIGAARSDVLGLVLWRGLLPPLIGLVIGIPSAMSASRVLVSSLYGVQALDPLTYVTVAVAVVLVALAAAYFPARKATRVDPMVALRYE